MVLPIGDVNPTRRFPIVTLGLLLLNVGVFVFAQPWWSDDPCVQQAFFLEHAAVPYEVVRGEPLDAGEVTVTAPPACRLQPVPDKDVYESVLRAMFLHAGWLHLLGNVLYLWVFGNNVEDRLGHLRFLVFYLATGVVATLVFVAANPTSGATLVGATGAIAGVLGAYLVLFPRAPVTVVLPPLVFLPFRLPAVLVLGSWFVLQLIGDRAADMAGGGVAYLAHVAGFVAGLGGVLLLRGTAVPPPPRRHPPLPPGYPGVPPPRRRPRW